MNPAICAKHSWLGSTVVQPLEFLQAQGIPAENLGLESVETGPRLAKRVGSSRVAVMERDWMDPEDSEAGLRLDANAAQGDRVGALGSPYASTLASPWRDAEPEKGIRSYPRDVCLWVVHQGEGILRQLFTPVSSPASNNS